MASSSLGRTLALLIDLFKVLEMILNGLIIGRTFSWAKRARRRGKITSGIWSKEG
jgi:hypothetical protein